VHGNGLGDEGRGNSKGHNEGIERDEEERKKQSIPPRHDKSPARGPRAVFLKSKCVCFCVRVCVCLCVSVGCTEQEAQETITATLGVHLVYAMCSHTHNNSLCSLQLHPF